MISLRQKFRVLAALLFFWAGLAHAPAQDAEVLDLDLKTFVMIGETLVGIRADSGLVTSVGSFSSFTQRRAAPSDPLEDYFAIDARGQTVVVVGTDALTLRSTDGGTSWAVAQTPVVFGDMRAVSPGQDSGATTPWLAVGDDGLGGVVLMSADDGATWSEVAVLAEVMLADVAWTGTQWVACGAGFFQEGKAYTSADGMTWTEVTLPEATSPLLAVGADGAGNVVLLGEAGAVLTSSDHGATFTVVTNPFSSGDLTSIFNTGEGRFVLGGDERIVLDLVDGVLTERYPVGPGAPVINELAEVGGVLYVAGPYASLRDIDLVFELTIQQTTADEVTLVLQRSNPSRFYFLEVSSDLQTWTPVENSTRGGTGRELTWTIPRSGRQFWRVGEP